MQKKPDINICSPFAPAFRARDAWQGSRVDAGSFKGFLTQMKPKGKPVRLAAQRQTLHERGGYMTQEALRARLPCCHPAIQRRKIRCFGSIKRKEENREELCRFKGFWQISP